MAILIVTKPLVVVRGASVILEVKIFPPVVVVLKASVGRVPSVGETVEGLGSVGRTVVGVPVEETTYSGVDMVDGSPVEEESVVETAVGSFVEEESSVVVIVGFVPKGSLVVISGLAIMQGFTHILGKTHPWCLKLKHVPGAH